MDAVLDEGSIVDRCVWYVNQADLNERQAQPEERRVKPGERDWETLRRFFGWASVDLVERTFQATTQMGRLSNAVHLKNTIILQIPHSMCTVIRNPLLRIMSTLMSPP